eukprot:5403498-Amphidinium_carterae.1
MTHCKDRVKHCLVGHHCPLHCKKSACGSHDILARLLSLTALKLKLIQTPQPPSPRVRLCHEVECAVAVRWNRRYSCGLSTAPAQHGTIRGAQKTLLGTHVVLVERPSLGHFYGVGVVGCPMWIGRECSTIRARTQHI